MDKVANLQALLSKLESDNKLLEACNRRVVEEKNAQMKLPDHLEKHEYVRAMTEAAELKATLRWTEKSRKKYYDRLVMLGDIED